ncbi:hypothetical protein Q672_01655 [Marinobacter sp. EVN1]|nr:hypothetical protein Q672_01655 [Marinobacter sp. EVN1]
MFDYRLFIFCTAMTGVSFFIGRMGHFLFYGFKQLRVER